MTMHAILLQAPTAGGSNYTGFIFFGIMLLVMYLFMIRPQQRRQKEQRKYIESIQVGNPVVTSGGIHGKVISLTKDTLVIEVDKGVKITIERSSISYDAVKTQAAVKS